MCDLDATGAPSTFRVILSPAALARMLPTLDLSCEENDTCLKWNWSLVDELAELLKLQRIGQFPDELVKIEGSQIHYVTSRTY